MNTLDYISISQFLGENFREIKTIDLFNSQYLVETPKKEHSVNYPAVYIEFASVNYEDMTNRLRQGNAILKIHIVLSSFSDTSNIHTKSPNIQKQILEHYNLANRIASKLTSFSPCTGLTNFILVEEQTDTNHDQILAEIYTFNYIALDISSSSLKDYIKKVIDDFLVNGVLKPIKNSIKIE